MIKKLFNTNNNFRLTLMFLFAGTEGSVDYMTPSHIEGKQFGNFLDFNAIMDEDLIEKLKVRYEILKKMFEELSYDDGGNKKWILEYFELRIYPQNGRGFSESKHMQDSYKSLGFIPKQFIFKVSDSAELDSAILTILYYTFTIPDAFIMVHASGVGNHNEGNFLNIDGRGIYSPEYVIASGYSSNLNPISIWTGQYLQLTPDKFKQYISQLGGIYIDAHGSVFTYKGNLDDGELSRYTMYCNMGLETHDPSRNTEKLMMWYIYHKYFKNLLVKDKDIKIYDFTDLNINDEDRQRKETIIDLNSV